MYTVMWIRGNDYHCQCCEETIKIHREISDIEVALTLAARLLAKKRLGEDIRDVSVMDDKAKSIDLFTKEMDGKVAIEMTKIQTSGEWR